MSQFKVVIASLLEAGVAISYLTLTIVFYKEVTNVINGET